MDYLDGLFPMKKVKKIKKKQQEDNNATGSSLTAATEETGIKNEEQIYKERMRQFLTYRYE